MTFIERKVVWSTKSEWAWPIGDEKLLQVFDQVSDVDVIMQFVDDKSVCIQAGGACGIWPLRFSKFFKEVLTFEPVMDNYMCLLQNVSSTINVTAFPFALSYESLTGRMVLDPSEHNNAGASYFQEGNGTTITTQIDGYITDACGLIQLDVEGHELEALKGAIRTLKKFKPVVVIEEKTLPYLENRDPKEARYFLESLGYKEVANVHRDVVFKC